MVTLPELKAFKLPGNTSFMNDEGEGEIQITDEATNTSRTNKKREIGPEKSANNDENP